MSSSQSPNKAVSNLRELIRIPTISRLEPSETDWPKFAEFRKRLAELYPLTHSKLELELVDQHALLYKWVGKSNQEPTVLMAHYDVVSATDEGWEHPPFEAELVDDSNGNSYLWGRGTLDDKGSLVCVMEAIEAALERGESPKNDVYLSFGHNEEVSGTGAKQIVDLLEARGIKPALVLDEGGAVVEGIFPGVTKPIAVVGVSEKGILTLRLTVVQQGGHASTPPDFAATVRLARAILRLNRKPFKKSFVATNLEMIQTLGSEAKQPLKWVFTNIWLTKRPLLWLFGRLSDETRAMVRTTQVVTQLSGAQASNAIPEKAEAIINIRVAVDSTVQAAVDHVRKAIRDSAVLIEPLHPTEPSPVSPTDGPGWELIKSTILKVYPEVVVTPYILLGASDSRHFTRISNRVYRFNPFEMSTEERGTLHAKNERIKVATFLKGVEFYKELVSAL